MQDPTQSLSSAPTQAPLGPTPGPAPAGPAVGLVEGTGPRLSQETQSLLRRRLRAVTLFFIFAFAAFGVVNLFTEHPSSWILMAVPLLLSGAAFALLASPRPLSLRQLRAVELVVFGGLTVFLMVADYLDTGRVLRTLANVHPLERTAAVRVGLILLVFEYFALMLVYGTFIPNAWPRTAVVAALMVAAPVVVVLVVRTQYPAVAEVLDHQRYTEDQLIGLTYLVLAAVLATYSTHIVNRLRTEVFEARQFGQYRLRQRLGGGGMGDVYLAEHQLLKRPCAIKLIRPERVNDPGTLARFEREVRATARLSHANTVEIYDYGRTDDGVFYYVMEYLPGLSLADIVGRYGPMEPARAIHFLRQTCGALREAHAMGLIHRDIKPANIVAAERGGVRDVAKLLDFGLVKPLREPDESALTQVGTVSGSLLYISPEQALAQEELDARTDIYSLGATAYCLLAGHPPFEGGTPTSLIVAHARDAVKPLSAVRPDVPADLERVVLRCLAKRPDDRYPDVVALEADLGACADADRWTQERAARWWAQFGGSTTVVSAPAGDTPDGPGAACHPTEEMTQPRIDPPDREPGIDPDGTIQT